MRYLFVCVPALATALAAQNYVVSPAYCVNAEGGTNNTIPFWGTTGFYRYQQPMNDLRGTPRLLTEIAWRRDGQFGAPARTLDMEVSLADTDMPVFTTMFASNHANPAVNVFTRKMVTTPDHSAIPAGLPTPWTFALPFDTPFVSLGVKELLYDLTIYSFTTTASYPLDAVSGAVTTATGGYSMVGTGCTTTNGQMELRATFNISMSANSLSLVWNLLRGPATASTTVLFGLGNPNLPIPGLCGAGLLHTNGMFSVSGTTAGNGTLNTAAIVLAPYDPQWSVFTLTAQAFSLDASQGALPLAVSNGLASPIPQMPTATPSHRLYATTSTATTGTLGTSYGLVTRFRH